jgi:hypothetical protein
VTAPSIERARLQLPCGPLASVLGPRFVRALAAHTSLTIDRVDELALLVEALTIHATQLLPDGEIELTARVLADGLEITAGRFERGIPQRILAADREPAVITRLASTAEVREGRDSRERLHVVVR